MSDPSATDAQDSDWSDSASERVGTDPVTGGGGYAPAELESFQSGSGQQSQEVNLDAIVDIPVTLSVEIGQARISIRNLLQLNQGSVVELDRLAGEPLDVLVNGTLVAHGEVVVVNDKFGVRLTDVVSARERLRKLR